MKRGILFLVLLAIFAGACEKKEAPEPELEFVPTDVLVKTNPDFTIQQLFELVNSLGLDVEYVSGMSYTSLFPADSLDHILSMLREKPYLNAYWKTNGYVSAATGELMFFPRFADITNTEYQTDWLSTMDDLLLSEYTDTETAGYLIFFHVPEGAEKAWVKRFEKHSFVDWAELNYIVGIELH